MTTDQDIIDRAVAAYRAGATISDLEARVLASVWHDGQDTALYALSSTGAITEGCWRELDDLTLLTRREVWETRALLDYVHLRGPRAPVPGWSELSW